VQPRWRRVRAHPRARSRPRVSPRASSKACHRGPPCSLSFWRQALVLYITIYICYLTTLNVCRSCPRGVAWIPSCMNSGFLFEMDTSMLGRITALLIRDLGRSRVIFLALARGQELIVFILIMGSLMVYWHGSRVDALSMRQKWN
jgi:hypothetical protein